MTNKKESFTSADTFPSKLLHNKVIEYGKIQPLHIQFIPTNRCNLNCSFCSCADRNQQDSIPIEKAKELVSICSFYGTKAMTITGGGEPLMYKPINELIDHARRKNIDVGLVTNGKLLERLGHHPNLTWCRISSSDDREPAYDKITNAIKINSDTDWAFSHVVTAEMDIAIIKELVGFANEYNFSHVRLVSDLLDLNKTPSMGIIKKELDTFNINDKRVIYQDRKDYTNGTKDCHISLLKPVISPEGIFPCCGAQYAIKDMPKDYTEEMKMGDLNQLETIIQTQKKFDGSKCDKCYYSQYNDSISKMKNKPEHNKFV